MNGVHGGSDRGFRPPGNGVIDSCGPLCGFWELRLNPLKEQQLLTAEPSLLPDKEQGKLNRVHVWFDA